MIIFKIGGGKDINREGIAKGLSLVHEPFLIVHGANGLRDELALKTGYDIKRITSVSGYSSVFSDPGLIDLMMMAYAGLANKRWIETLQRHGINAVGLTGLDGRLIAGKRNAGIRMRKDSKILMVRDYSGKPSGINAGLLKMLLDRGYVPVLTVPIIDENGYAVNSENDDITALLAEELKADQIVMFIEEKGYLRDPSDPDSAMERISKSELAFFVENASGRIKRKLHALLKIAGREGARAVISDGRGENPVWDALNNRGTVIS
ncbi:MAG TPA: acetylglutamate kinase [Candidatus Aminicenantes bacterium]|nr:acetylglutamate kinase [Candidatus Aminicenantes bacterium]